MVCDILTGFISSSDDSEEDTGRDLGFLGDFGRFVFDKFGDDFAAICCSLC